MPEPWKIDAQNAVRVLDLRSALDNSIIGDATVTGRLLDATTFTEIPTSGFSIPVQSAPLGNYAGVGPALSLTRGATYFLELLGVRSGQNILRDWIEVVAGN